MLICSLFFLSFRSYSTTRNHQRRSPTSVSSARSSSYHSPTRSSSPISSTQAVNINSRPSSPATNAGSSSRYSTFMDQEGSSGGIHHSSVSRATSRPLQTNPESISNDSVHEISHDRIEIRNERSGVIQTSCAGGAFSANTTPVHHRTSSGPSIAINILHDSEANNGK